MWQSLDEIEDSTHDYVGTTVESVLGGRNSWEVWKEKVLSEGDKLRDEVHHLASPAAPHVS